MIRLRNVKKNFGSNEALKGVSVDINRGEVLGLLGHNGAGKTTTLRLIATLLDPTEGFIERPEHFKSRIGYFPDEPFLFEYLTGREMLWFITGLYRLPRETALPRVERYLELFELQSSADQLLTTCSRGTRRKLSLAGSLLHDPVYWLLDEPSEALDPVAIRALKDLIHRRKEEGCAVLISTHLLALAESVCDRLVILDHGAVIFDGSLQALRDRTLLGASLEDMYVSLVK